MTFEEALRRLRQAEMRAKQLQDEMDRDQRY